MTSLIIRKDNKTNRPVAFVAGSVNNGQIQAWKPRMSKPEIVGMDYYQSTKAIDPAKAERVAKMYAKANGGTDVMVRERLPKNYSINGGVYKSELQATEPSAKAPKRHAGKARTNAQANASTAPAIDIQALATQLAALLAPTLAK